MSYTEGKSPVVKNLNKPVSVQVSSASHCGTDIQKLNLHTNADKTETGGDLLFSKPSDASNVPLSEGVLASVNVSVIKQTFDGKHMVNGTNSVQHKDQKLSTNIPNASSTHGTKLNKSIPNEVLDCQSEPVTMITTPTHEHQTIGPLSVHSADSGQTSSVTNSGANHSIQIILAPQTEGNTDLQNGTLQNAGPSIPPVPPPPPTLVNGNQNTQHGSQSTLTSTQNATPAHTKLKSATLPARFVAAWLWEYMPCFRAGIYCTCNIPKRWKS